MEKIKELIKKLLSLGTREDASLCVLLVCIATMLFQCFSTTDVCGNVNYWGFVILNTILLCLNIFCYTRKVYPRFMFYISFVPLIWFIFS